MEKVKVLKTIKRKKLQGIVTKLSSALTIKVETENKSTHPKYKKVIRVHKEYLVHCEDKEIKVGDTVIIEEGKPKSKSKCFYLVKKI
jgi:small subunit ribosomal protein S17